MRFLTRVLHRVHNHVSVALSAAFGRSWAGVLVGGYRIAVPTPLEGGLRRSLIKGTYEQDERIVVDKVIARNDRILELGGAVGCLAVHYSRAAAGGHVLVEANADLMPCLRDNLARHGVKNVVVVNKLASWHGDGGTFYKSPAFYSSSVVRTDGMEHELESVDVNALIAEHGIDVIICDVEGFEYDLIPKLSLESIKTVVVEIHQVEDVNQKLAALMHTLQDAGLIADVRAWRGNVLVYRRHL